MPQTDRTARLREFGLSLGTAFGIGAAIFSYQRLPRAAACLALAGGLLLAAAALKPELLRPAEWTWKGAARAVQWINSRPAAALALLAGAFPRLIFLKMPGFPAKRRDRT